MGKKRLSHGYLKYLKSPIWKELRDTVCERDNQRCTKCDKKGELHVHHLTYERLFDEELEDLITLCKLCHEEAHGKCKPGPREYIEIAKGILVVKGEKPTKKQLAEAKRINERLRRRNSWKNKIRAKKIKK